LEAQLKKVLEDKETMNIANYAASGYSSSLTKDEIENCIYNAVWNALDKFDESKGAKFSTFLHRGVRLQCQKRLNFNKRYKTTNYYEDSVSHKFSSNLKNQIYSQDLKFEIKDEIENCEDPDILYDRYYNNMTLTEIANKKNTSYETIRNKIKKNLKIIKKRIS
jgi:DNA-directed RNA polymerase specialized sigma subunit|tara:strand:+ start:3209 stop:3700 length:492 start_codon:yes stop_codon:yes gene_type:complete